MSLQEEPDLFEDERIGHRCGPIQEGSNAYTAYTMPTTKHVILNARPAGGENALATLDLTAVFMHFRHVRAKRVLVAVCRCKAEP